MYAWKNFDVRNDDHIRDAIKRSNVVINLIAKDKETWNFDFEEVNVDIPRRIAKLAAENPLTERFLHFSCIGATKDSASRRLRTKVRTQSLSARSASSSLTEDASQRGLLQHPPWYLLAAHCEGHMQRYFQC